MGLRAASDGGFRRCNFCDGPNGWLRLLAAAKVVDGDPFLLAWLHPNAPARRLRLNRQGDASRSRFFYWKAALGILPSARLRFGQLLSDRLQPSAETPSLGDEAHYCAGREKVRQPLVHARPQWRLL